MSLKENPQSLLNEIESLPRRELSIMGRNSAEVVPILPTSILGLSVFIHTFILAGIVVIPQEDLIHIAIAIHLGSFLNLNPIPRILLGEVVDVQGFYGQMLSHWFEGQMQLIIELLKVHFYVSNNVES